MGYTLGRAAKATGKSKTTIQRAIKKGKISAKKDAHGQWNIDPAELHRFYPAVTGEGNAEPVTAGTPANTELHREISGLKDKLREKDEQVADLRTDRDAWRDQAQAVKLIADGRKADKEPWFKLGPLRLG